MLLRVAYCKKPGYIPLLPSNSASTTQRVYYAHLAEAQLVS